MRMPLLRPLLALFAVLAAVLGHAGTLTVTSPADDGYLGLSNAVTFNITGASSKVMVNVVYTAPGASSGVKLTTSVTPDDLGKGSGSIPLNFTSAATEGAYTLVVSATEANNSYASTTLTETVDVTAPKFSESLPTTGAYTRGDVKVRATLEETNLQGWTVTVNSGGNTQTIGSGESTAVAADYPTAGLQTDGNLSFVITATDLAGNVISKTLSVTLDRQKPTVAIVFPSNNGSVRGDINVVVDITDASTNSVDRTGIDVLVEKPDGTYVGRVTLVTLKATSGTVQRWTGRLKSGSARIPATFLLAVSVVDRAGNAAPTQQVTVKYRK